MLFFKKKKPEMTKAQQSQFLDKMFPETKKEMDNIAKRNTELEKLAVARQAYKVDNDLDKLISVYEELFVHANPPVKSPDEFELAKLYLKAGQNDKAWRYLNTILLRGNTPDYLIYDQQASILKKENKYLDAAHLYCLCYLSKAKDIGNFQEDKFTKDIKVCGNKLGWNDAKIADLIGILRERIAEKDFDLASLSKEFKAMEH